jgi:nucleotide-binding universal stress UspA family protein
MSGGGRSVQDDADADLGYRRLLVAVDASAWAKRAVEHTCALARRTGGEVLVLHVRPVIQEQDGVATALEDERRVNRLLAKERSIFKRSGIVATFEARSAHLLHVAEKIVEIAAKWGADAIVTGAQDHSGVPGLVPGRTARRLPQLTTLPVIIVD